MGSIRLPLLVGVTALVMLIVFHLINQYLMWVHSYIWSLYLFFSPVKKCYCKERNQKVLPTNKGPECPISLWNENFCLAELKFVWWLIMVLAACRKFFCSSTWGIAHVMRCWILTTSKRNLINLGLLGILFCGNKIALESCRSCEKPPIFGGNTAQDYLQLNACSKLLQPQ